MSNLFEPILSLSQFKLPPQDILLLSFCKSNKASKVKYWAEQLKLTQVNTSSIALYGAVPEIVRLKTDAKNRFEMLEALWAPIHQCLEGLNKEFLQQPLILPEKALNAALLAQALQKQMLDGYSVCIAEFIVQKKLKGHQQDLLSRCLFQAINAITTITLRSYQLYTPVPVTMWLRAHVLYQIAEYYDLQNKLVPQNKDKVHILRSIHEAYARLVVLGSIRPNQLSQNDIYHAYNALAHWVKFVQFFPSATADSNNFHLINLENDAGPITKSRFDGLPDHRVIELDFQNLVSQLSKMSSGQKSDSWSGGTTQIQIPVEMSASLVAHILDCWSNSMQRNQDRQRTEIDAEACIGLIDCHHHLCGGIDFMEFLHALPEASTGDDDFLSGGFDSLVSSLSKKAAAPEKPKPLKQTIFRIAIQNISAGGYCILWRGELPNRIEAGELIGLREQGRRAWSVGVIRWIRQLKNASQLGIQLLSSQPVPYGAAVMYDMGGYSDHMRAIHLPSPIMPDQPPSLLTASAPFHENSRVKLKQDEQNIDIRLQKCVFSTSKIRLFSFETLSSDTQ